MSPFVLKVKEALEVHGELRASQLHERTDLHLSSVNKALRILRSRNLVYISGYEVMGRYRVPKYRAGIAEEVKRRDLVEEVLKVLRRQPSLTASEVEERLGISRAHANRILLGLLKSKEIHICGYTYDKRRRRRFAVGDKKSVEKVSLGEEKVLNYLKRRDACVSEIQLDLNLSETYVRKLILRLRKKDLVHVSGYYSSKRRKPKVYSYGSGPSANYPYVSIEEQKENLSRYQKEYYRRAQIREATASGGVFGGMVAQLKLSNS